jgi:hypothetical protein
VTFATLASFSCCAGNGCALGHGARKVQKPRGSLCEVHETAPGEGALMLHEFLMEKYHA